MRRACFIFFLSFAACDSASTVGVTPPLPPDGVYHATVDPIENTCGRDFLPTSWSGQYEVMRRMDGLYDLKNYLDSAEWPLKFEGVTVKNGVVDHVEQWRSGYTGHTFDQSVVGKITREEIDVEVRMDWELKDNATPCVQRVLVHGPAWRLLDPASVDGRYRVMVSAYTPDGTVCPGDTPDEHPIQYYLFDVIQPAAGGPLKINFVTTPLRGTLPAPGPDGTINTGKGWDYLQAWVKLVGFDRMWGSVQGTVRPDALDLILEFSEFDTDPCAYRFHVVGAKSLPALDNVTNEYRASSSVQDVCAGRTSVYDERYFIVDQGDRQIELIDSYDFTNYFNLATDGSFQATFDKGGERTAYDGRIATPLLNFTSTFRSSDDNYRCALISAVSAHARFVFDP